MSTERFASQRGGRPEGPPGEDPIASLDADDNGQVSADEFGIGSDSSSDLKALFSAIDSNGDGSLSTDETDSFRQSFISEMQSRAESGDAPPPPPSRDNGLSFVEQLAQVYASWQTADGEATTSLSVQA